ncbi:MAG: SGNH/GDSL hydrolase family protein [Chitinivibrionales bacterium]|nr:SGNH/GDSL hydrolase family protein [Chitinivibrionales bacterium]
MSTDLPLPAPVPERAPKAIGIQRTMRLLAECSPEDRRRVKILVYGQSLSKQKWWEDVATCLRKRYPHADIDIRNRSVGGFSSARLVHAAEQDIYPEYPDLVIFRVSGDHRRYEDIVRRIRSRTTAEMAIWNTPPSWLPTGESDDDARMGGYTWDVACSYEIFPEIARRYGCAFMDIRTEWKDYLHAHGLSPSHFTVSATDSHLNDAGNWLLARLIERRLVHDPSLGAENTVHEYAVGEDIDWRNDTVELPFDGNRIDAVTRTPGNGSSRVLIDGRPPSSFRGCYSFSRPNDIAGQDWPWTVAAMIRVDSEALPLVETWTITLTEINNDCTRLRFQLEGSRTGHDGEGCSDERFVSGSGRVVIEPDYWWLAQAHALLGTRFEPGNEIQWHVTPHFTDEYQSPSIVDPAREHTVTLAQGLPNGRHILTLEGRSPIDALRVYCPPVG